VCKEKNKLMEEKPCTAKPASECNDCTLNSVLMCRYEIGDSVHFFMIILPFFVAAIGGVIAAGFGWWLFGWLAYMLFFFFVWEARVLCSHCPYWAEDGSVLHCHANYGVVKLWRYRPGPMNRSERMQFLAGVLIFVLYPLVILIVGQEYLLAAIGLASAGSFGYLLRRNICNRCVNFSCPLNNVPPETRRAFFARNPVIASAWQQSGS
jgi:hypothetical protein